MATILAVLYPRLRLVERYVSARVMHMYVHGWCIACVHVCKFHCTQQHVRLCVCVHTKWTCVNSVSAISVLPDTPEILRCRLDLQPCQIKIVCKQPGPCLIDAHRILL